MTTYYQQAKSNNPYRNRGGTVLQGGNVPVSNTANVTNVLTLANNSFYTGDVSGRVMLAVSPASSGNVGTKTVLASGTFGKNTKGQYICQGLPGTLAGSPTTLLRSGASDFNHRNGLTLTPSPKYQRLDITSWNYVTGAITSGGGRGSTVTLGPDQAAQPTNAVPGELVYMVKGVDATQDDYKSRTNE